MQNSFPKILVLVLALLSCTTFYAQKEKNKAVPFIRVYDLNGTKISKGRIAMITDTSLVVSRGEKSVNLELSKIGFIKTKRSAGNNILWGAGLGVGVGAIVGIASGDTDGGFLSYSKGEGAGGFGLFFGAVGAGIGAITIVFKKSNTFVIEGDLSKWKTFKEAMLEE